MICSSVKRFFFILRPFPNGPDSKSIRLKSRGQRHNELADTHTMAIFRHALTDRPPFASTQPARQGAGGPPEWTRRSPVSADLHQAGMVSALTF
jgi:hypothetical protein